MLYRFKHKIPTVVISSWEESQLLEGFSTSPFGARGWSRPHSHHVPRAERKHRVAFHSSVQWVFTLLDPVSGSYGREHSLLEIISQICFTSKIFRSDISILKAMIYISNFGYFPRISGSHVWIGNMRLTILQSFAVVLGSLASTHQLLSFISWLSDFLRWAFSCL